MEGGDNRTQNKTRLLTELACALLTSNAKSLCSYFLKLPASRGLFSVVFAELTGARKRDLCPGSKRSVLNMRHGHQATEPSREAMLLCGLTNCKRMRERQLAQVTVSKQYWEHAFCKRRPRLWTAIESKSVSTQGRGKRRRRRRKRGLCLQGITEMVITCFR